MKHTIEFDTRNEEDAKDFPIFLKAIEMHRALKEFSEEVLYVLVNKDFWNDEEINEYTARGIIHEINSKFHEILRERGIEL